MPLASEGGKPTEFYPKRAGRAIRAGSRVPRPRLGNGAADVRMERREQAGLQDGTGLPTKSRLAHRGQAKSVPCGWQQVGCQLVLTVGAQPYVPNAGGLDRLGGRRAGAMAFRAHPPPVYISSPRGPRPYKAKAAPRGGLAARFPCGPRGGKLKSLYPKTAWHATPWLQRPTRSAAWLWVRWRL